ncbi:hypothetical protein BDN71DRAFT_1444166 [Pleurotus eryngii]|uniref:Hydrophobin n=1 Tax=Pleurotus eryngii TaxID=5323 RepID=A0A9P6A0P9_PLEER|nr:hypothetical protein BDN71DRAFT_1444166 [Pleurotus eryngii]
MFLASLVTLATLCVSYAQADAGPVKCSMVETPNIPLPVPTAVLPVMLPCVPTVLPGTSLGIVNIQQTACSIGQVDCEYECSGAKPGTLHACMSTTGLPGLPAV